MKKYILFLPILLISFSYTPAPTAPTQDLSAMKWLLGKWKVLNDNPEIKVYEEWQQESEKRFTGKSYAIKGASQDITETLQLVSRADGIYYIADVRGNSGPVEFKLTKQDEETLYFENPRHDFPQWIRYVKIHDKMLQASIGSLDDKKKSMIFHMEKVE